MVEFREKLDRNNKIYLPKVLREAGFKGAIRIRPTENVAIIYPEGVDLSSVKSSIELLLSEIDNLLKKQQPASDSRDEVHNIAEP
jgi:hypothetical protein